MKNDQKIKIIKQIVAKLYDLTEPDISGDSRVAHISAARITAVGLAKELTEEIPGRIAPEFSRERTNIIYLLSQCADRRESDPKFQDRYIGARKVIGEVLEAVESGRLKPGAVAKLKVGFTRITGAPPVCTVEGIR